MAVQFSQASAQRQLRDGSVTSACCLKLALIILRCATQSRQRPTLKRVELSKQYHLSRDDENIQRSTEGLTSTPTIKEQCYVKLIIAGVVDSFY